MEKAKPTPLPPLILVKTSGGRRGHATGELALVTYAYWNARVPWRSLALHHHKPQECAHQYANRDADHDSPEHHSASFQNNQVDLGTFYHQCLPERNRTFGLLQALESTRAPVQCGLTMRWV